MADMQLIKWIKSWLLTKIKKKLFRTYPNITIQISIMAIDILLPFCLDLLLVC